MPPGIGASLHKTSSKVSLLTEQAPNPEAAFSSSNVLLTRPDSSTPKRAMATTDKMGDPAAMPNPMTGAGNLEHPVTNVDELKARWASKEPGKPWSQPLLNPFANPVGWCAATARPPWDPGASPVVHVVTCVEACVPDLRTSFVRGLGLVVSCLVGRRHGRAPASRPARHCMSLAFSFCVELAYTAPCRSPSTYLYRTFDLLGLLANAKRAERTA